MPAGRPTSLTSEVRKTIIEAIRAGNYRSSAAALAGVDRHSINNWVARGERGEEPYASFAHELSVVEAQAEADLLAGVRAGGREWTAKAWLLERRWPGRWSGRVRMTVEDTIEEMLKRVAEVLDADNLEKVRLATRPDLGSRSAENPRH